MSAARRWLVVLPVLALLGVATLEAVRASQVDTRVTQAILARAGWTGSAIPPEASWRATWEGLQSAAVLDPADPVVHEQLGLVAARRPDDPALLRQAADHFTRSLQLRPVSPRTWANLVEASYLAGETGPVFRQALVTAGRLGPSEPYTQRVLAFYGLAIWDELGAGERAAVDAAVAAGMRRKPLEMLQIADRRGRLTTACRHLAAELPRRVDPNVSRLCLGTEARQ